MRLAPAFIAMALSIPLAAADNPRPVIQADAVKTGAAAADARCSPTRSYSADTHAPYRGDKLAPRKLSQLPPATGYMAVYRHIGPCEAPLTMVEFRNPRRR